VTADVDRPVFVVGCPRSGTTLLSLMLHAHPRLAIPPETRFLISTWRERHRFGDLSTDTQRRALAKACVRKKSRITDLDLDPDEVRDAILAAPPTIGSAFGTVFRLYAERHGAARWGDKRPAYFQEVDVLLRLFPDAQVVHVVRDARANVASLKSMPWWPYGSIGSMATWAQAEWCSRRNAHRLPSHVFHVVRYESLVADPEPVLRELCAFLGEDFEPAMLQPAAVSDVVPEGKTWHGNLANDVSTDRVDAWRDDLEPWEIGLLEAVLRRSLRRWDYPLTGAGSMPAPHRLARFAVELGYRHLAMRTRWAAEQRDDRRTDHPVAAQLTSGQRRIAAERGELLPT
jgi:hypothetical protein